MRDKLSLKYDLFKDLFNFLSTKKELYAGILTFQVFWIIGCAILMNYSYSIGLILFLFFIPVIFMLSCISIVIVIASFLTITEFLFTFFMNILGN